MPTYVMSKRRMERLLRADKTCRELRHAITAPWEADWNKVAKLLLKWLSKSGKDAYTRP